MNSEKLLTGSTLPRFAIAESSWITTETRNLSGSTILTEYGSSSISGLRNELIFFRLKLVLSLPEELFAARPGGNLCYLELISVF